jgi:hypothetical protein
LLRRRLKSGTMALSATEPGECQLKEVWNRS